MASKNSKKQSLRSTDSELLGFLTDLSSFLIQAGYTSGQVSDLTKRAFVEAASRLCRLGNGRVNQSRVAAITGLSRAEVKRLTNDGGRPAREPRRSQHRALRVLDGWVSDPDFTSKGGAPKSLRLIGLGATFAELVKRYSGDIPPRAILSELLRLNLVASNGRTARLISTEAGLPLTTQVSRSLISALNNISRDLGSSRFQPVRIYSREIESLTDEIAVQILRRRTQDSISSFVTSISEAIRATSSKDKSKVDGRRKKLLRVSVVVSESRVSQSK